MIPRMVPSRQPRNRFLCLMPGAADGGITCRVRRRTLLLATLPVVLAVLASPPPANAWWHGRTFGPSIAAGYAWAPGPWVLFPFQRPGPDYRYSVPPGVPLSYDDPATGTTYCWSQSTGFYFACAYAPPVAFAVGPVPAPPSGAPPSRPDWTVPPASGVLLFRLPREAQATIDGVPIGLSDGLGIHALAPGTHRVVLRVSGKETAHTVEVRSHRILTITPTGVVATEP